MRCGDFAARVTNVENFALASATLQFDMVIS
jgi:hypothetical protein